MEIDWKEFGRRNLRVPGYDYSQGGAYFVTVCVLNGNKYLGRINNGHLELNRSGEIVLESWKWLIQNHGYLKMDCHIVMPNHFHGILHICGDCRGRSRTAPTDSAYKTKFKTLGRLVGIFKTVSTKKINLLHGTPGNIIWQRNYYEHIIRNDDSLRRIREYIQNNPLRWHLDRENGGKSGSDPFDAWLDSFKLNHHVSR